MPLIVTTFPAHEPVTPAGRPVIVAPVAPVVAYVIGVIEVFIQTICASVPSAELRVIVLSGVTVIEPFAVMLPQPPVNVMI